MSGGKQHKYGEPEQFYEVLIFYKCVSMLKISVLGRIWKKTPNSTLTSFIFPYQVVKHWNCCISEKLRLLGMEMPFLGWYISGGAQKGKHSYIGIFKI